MSISFKYDVDGHMRFGMIRRPVANVSFQSPVTHLWADIWMVVDTGADFSILPKYFAQKLKVSLKDDCVQEVTEGVGGKQTIFLMKNPISAKIGNYKRDVPLAFFDTDNIPPLLGRLGFLETFDVEFLKKHIVTFKD